MSSFKEGGGGEGGHVIVFWKKGGRVKPVGANRSVGGLRVKFRLIEVDPDAVWIWFSRWLAHGLKIGPVSQFPRLTGGYRFNQPGSRYLENWLFAPRYPDMRFYASPPRSLLSSTSSRCNETCSRSQEEECRRFSLSLMSFLSRLRLTVLKVREKERDIYTDSCVQRF